MYAKMAFVYSCMPQQGMVNIRHIRWPHIKEGGVASFSLSLHPFHFHCTILFIYLFLSVDNQAKVQKWRGIEAVVKAINGCHRNRNACENGLHVLLNAIPRICKHPTHIRCPHIKEGFHYYYYYYYYYYIYYPFTLISFHFISPPPLFLHISYDPEDRKE